MSSHLEPENLPPRSQSLFLSSGSGKTGVLMLHGFLGSPISIEPWARGVAAAGYTVSAPVLAGHDANWQELDHTRAEDWYSSAERALLELQKHCERVFIAGFSMGGALAVKLAANYRSELEGLILLNASIGDSRLIFRALPALKYVLRSVKNGPTDVSKPNPPAHIFPRTPLRALDSLRKFWREVQGLLSKVEIPAMVAYSENDHTVDSIWSEFVIDNIYSTTVRELIFERSFHNVALDYDAKELIEETIEFIQDVLIGEFDQLGENDEEDLINAEFESIVSGLNLAQSSPTTYLDELERPRADDFHEPNPAIEPFDFLGRLAFGLLVAGPAYLLLRWITGFSLFGLDVWPGVAAFVGGIVVALYKFTEPARREKYGEDGSF